MITVQMLRREMRSNKFHVPLRQRPTRRTGIALPCPARVSAREAVRLEALTFWLLASG